MTDDIKVFREVMRELCHLSIDTNFDSKKLDPILYTMRQGDSLQFNVEISAVPNDIIWMNMLDGDFNEDIRNKTLQLKIKDALNIR